MITKLTLVALLFTMNLIPSNAYAGLADIFGGMRPGLSRQEFTQQCQSMGGSVTDRSDVGPFLVCESPQFVSPISPASRILGHLSAINPDQVRSLSVVYQCNFDEQRFFADENPCVGFMESFQEIANSQFRRMRWRTSISTGTSCPVSGDMIRRGRSARLDEQAVMAAYWPAIRWTIRQRNLGFGIIGETASDEVQANVVHFATSGNTYSLTLLWGSN